MPSSMPQGFADSQITTPARRSENAPLRPLLLPAFVAANNQPLPATVPPRPSRSLPIPTPANIDNHILPLPLPLPMLVAANRRLLPPAFECSAPSPMTMPTRRSDHAPYFSGQVDVSIEDFLDEYEELANSCGLTEQQKVETIIRYIPHSLRYLWKSLDGYVSRNWTDFKLKLEEIYDGPSAPSRHSERNLLNFVRVSSKSRMNDKEDVLQYYWDFLALSKPLVDSQHLSIHKRDRAFWSGFHNKDRSEMYARLIAKHPDQPAGVYFDYLDVYRVARATFLGSHLLDSELDNTWNEPQSFRANQSERTHERWLDQDECDPRKSDFSHKTYERRPSSPTRHTPQDTTYQHSNFQQVSFMCETSPHLPHTFGNRSPSAHHIVQAVSAGTPGEESDSDDEDPFNSFQVFATERKKHETCVSNLLKLQVSTPITSTSFSAPAAAASAARTATTSAAPTQTMPQYTAPSAYSASVRKPVYSLLQQEIDIRIGDKVTEVAVTDPSPQIIAIREDLAREVGATVDTSQAPQMEGTNRVIDLALSRTESLPTCAGDTVFEVHARVVEHPPSTCAMKEDSELGKEDPFLHVFAAEKKKHDSETVRTRLPKHPPSATSTLASDIPSATVPVLIAPTAAVLAAAAPDVPPSPAIAVSATPLGPAAVPTPPQTILINKLQGCCIEVRNFKKSFSKPHLPHSVAPPHPRRQCRNLRLSHNKPEMSSGITHASQQVPFTDAVARPPVLKDPDKGSDFSLRTHKLQIICLTGDGQDFDPPRGVR